MNDHHDIAGEECFADRVYQDMSNTLLEIVQGAPDREVPSACVIEGIAALAAAVAVRIEDVEQRNDSIGDAICTLLMHSNCDAGAVMASVRELLEDELQPAGHA